MYQMIKNHEQKDRNSQLSAFYRQYFVQLVERELLFQQKKPLINEQYLQSDFLPRVHKISKLKITLDNTAAEAIICILDREPQYQSWNQSFLYSTEAAGNKSLVIDLESEKSVMGRREILVRIAYELRNINYITKRWVSRIEEDSINIRYISSRIEKLLSVTEKVTDPKKFLEIWDQVVRMSYSDFWDRFIISQQLCLKQDLIQRLLRCVSKNGTLQPDLVQQFTIKIRKQLQSLKPKLSAFLKRASSRLNLFSPYNEKLKEQIDRKLDKISKLLIEHFSKKNIYSGVSVSYYGSYLSEFCIVDSDVDLTLFLADTNGSLDSNRDFIKTALNSVLKFFQKNVYSLGIEDIKPLINDRIRVPVLTVKFKEGALTSIDVVINNRDGVKNSKFLCSLASNSDISALGTFLKRTGKVYDIIDRFKFSSYGLLLMMAYFLMRTKRIPFLKRNQIQELSVTVTMEETDFTELIIGFMKFYSSTGPFITNNEFLCLIQGCNNHSGLRNPQILINMHDPYDGTNPGRFKILNRNEFFSFTDSIALKLREFSQSKDEEAIKEVCRELLEIEF